MCCTDASLWFVVGPIFAIRLRSTTRAVVHLPGDGETTVRAPHGVVMGELLFHMLSNTASSPVFIKIARALAKGYLGYSTAIHASVFCEPGINDMSRMWS